jgi:hypothetical protein
VSPWFLAPAAALVLLLWPAARRWVTDRLLAAAQLLAGWLWTLRFVRWLVNKLIITLLVGILAASRDWLAQGVVAVLELNGLVDAASANSGNVTAIVQGVPLLWAKAPLPAAWPQAAKDLAEAAMHIIDDQLVKAGIDEKALTPATKAELFTAIEDRLLVRFPPPPPVQG